MKVIVSTLSFLVNRIIKEEMKKFKRLGVLSKEAARLNADRYEISKIHSNMKLIFEDLLPFEQRVRDLYPEMLTLFDLLLNKPKERNE